MLKKTVLISLITLFLGCAGGQYTNTSSTIAPDYVSPAMYMNFSCKELETQAADLIAKIPQLEKTIDKIKKDNDVWISTGAVLFFPLLPLLSPLAYICSLVPTLFL